MRARRLGRPGPPAPFHPLADLGREREFRRSLIIAFLCWRRAAQVMGADTALRGIAENCALSWACDHFCRSIRPPNQDAQLAQHPLPGASRNFCFCLRSAGCNRSADVWGILAVMPASSQRQLPLYGPPSMSRPQVAMQPAINLTSGFATITNMKEKPTIPAATARSDRCRLWTSKRGTDACTLTRSLERLLQGP
jgi:hypothetical protein